MNEKNERTMKEKMDQFVNDYGLVLPAMAVFTILNTIGVSNLKKNVKKQNKRLDAHKEAILLTTEALEMVDAALQGINTDINMIKKTISASK